jgi:uncharacterized membrane protein
MKKIPLLILSLVIVIGLTPLTSHAQFSNAEIQKEYLEKAVVTNATNPHTEVEPWSGIAAPTQTLEVKVLSGPDEGTTTSFMNNYTQVKTGDTIYIRHTTGGDAPDMWSLSDTYRLPILEGLAVLFLVLILFFGGLPGIRGIASLAGSLVLLFYVLLPGLYAGYSAMLLSVGVASLIIIVGSYITHGFNRTTSAAVLGMILTVFVTGTLAYFVVHMAHLSGFTSEDNAYLNINTGGKIDMVGLLFGGIMIGLLGVLYDIAIGQAVSVEELYRAGKNFSKAKVYKRGMRIGREHIGALINTLAIAYVGASLPILLLFKDQTAGIGYIINSERFATEIIRSLIGSIGLVLAVPVTTFIAAHLLYGRKQSDSTEVADSVGTHHH